MEDEVNYGPLKGLIGKWEGGKGLDVAPEEDGSVEENPYFETVVFEDAGSLNNAGQQKLSMVRYHQVVKRKSTGGIFHDEVGYWIWDESAKTIMRSFTIPRAVAVVAGGVFNGDVEKPEITIEVAASLESLDWGIAQSPFMRDNAKTTAFESKLVIKGNSLSFFQKTSLEIYGKSFDHTDENVLVRVD